MAAETADQNRLLPSGRMDIGNKLGCHADFLNKNVDTTPIETEPVTQVENICRSMKKNVLFPQSILCGILLWSVAMRFSQWKRDPVSELSNPISVFTVDS